MPESWKDIEREVARLVGGVRTWETDIDVQTPPPPLARWAIEVKNRERMSISELEKWLEHNQAKADAEGLLNALVIKRKAGRGVKTPFLLVVRLGEPAAFFFAQQLAWDASEVSEEE